MQLKQSLILLQLLDCLHIIILILKLTNFFLNLLIFMHLFLHNFFLILEFLLKFNDFINFFHLSIYQCLFTINKFGIGVLQSIKYWGWGLGVGLLTSSSLSCDICFIFFSYSFFYS